MKRVRLYVLSAVVILVVILGFVLVGAALVHIYHRQVADVQNEDAKRSAPASNLIIVRQYGYTGDGTKIQVGAPSISLRNPHQATIDDLCTGAIAVNSYGADDPEGEARILRLNCDRATRANANHDTWNCTDALLDLAENTHTGTSSDGVQRLWAFTNLTVATACHDARALNFYDLMRTSNDPAVPVRIA